MADDFETMAIGWAQNVEQVDERTWRAESARDGWAWLWSHLSSVGRAVFDREHPEGVQRIVPKKMLFRGQSCAEWSPLPGLLRIPDANDRQTADHAARIMESVIETEFSMLWNSDGAENWPPLAERCGYASAQHYGAKTNLLDWSVNPGTAVHFATKGGQPPGCTCGKASVAWISLEDAESLGLELVIPPPFVTRLYIQRGVFTVVSEEKLAEQIAAKAQRILFPPSPHFPQAAIDEEGLKSVQIEPPDPWFENLRNWSISEAENRTSSEIDPIPLSMIFNAHHGNHPAIVGARDSAIRFLYAADLFSQAKDLVDQLARREHLSGHCYDDSVIEIIRRHNPEFFAWAETTREFRPLCSEPDTSSRQT